MDRQLLAAGMLAVLLLSGCAKSSSDGDNRAQSARPSQSQATMMPGSNGVTTHRPAIASTDPAETNSSGLAAPPVTSPSAPPPPLVDAAPQESLWPATAPDITPLAPGSAPPAGTPRVESPTGRDFNPLRSSMLPPSAVQDGQNALRAARSFEPSAVPRVAPRSASSDSVAPPPPPQFVPESAAPGAAALDTAPPPAGGAAPPGDAAPSAATADPAPAAVGNAPGQDGLGGEAAAETRHRSADAAGHPAMPLADSAAASAPGPYDVVRVFYGTDRAEVTPLASGGMAAVVRFLPTGLAILVTLCLGLIAVSKRKSAALWALVSVGAIVSTGLALQASSTTLMAIRWQDKGGPRYGIDRGSLQLGICEVTIPKIHKTGELESPSILRLEVRDDLARHVALTKTERLQTEPFYAQLRQRVAASPRKELFVFIHGFDVSFENAARRTAQIHSDLKFPGAPIFFSWPANNKSLITYPADENTITWSAPHLKQFLLDIVQHSDAQSINLIAHSMGNRALTVALREIELEFRDQARLFNSVVLAAPDIDAEDFRVNIAPKMQNTAKFFTLYASSRDDALRASQLLHRSPRAGDAGRGLVVVPGIDTIDVSAIDTSPWGHSYYGSSDPVLQDLGIIMSFGRPPQERRWLSPADRDGLTYWIFEPSQTAGLSPVLPH